MNVNFEKNAILAQTHCKEVCKSYHTAWSLLRKVELVGGIYSDKSQFEYFFEQLKQENPLRILIAGSADSGITEVVASNFEQANIIVVDKCVSPLKMCETTVKGVDLQITCSDLLDYSPSQKFDLIVCHSLLIFFDEPQRIELLQQFESWLRPNGQIIMSTRMSPSQDSANKPSHVEVTQHGLSRVNASKAFPNIPKPVIEKCLSDFYEQFAQLSIPYRYFDDIKIELDQANLMVKDYVYGGKGVGYARHDVNEQPYSIVMSLSSLCRVET